MFVRFFIAFIGVSIALVGHSQTLTISNTGQTGNSGTNWSISGTTLTVTGTAEVNVSVISDKLAAGALTLVGNTTSFSVYVQDALSSSAANAFTIGASNNTGTISLRGAVSLGGSLTIIGGSVSVLEALTLTGSAALNITSLNTVISATTAIGGSATIAASGNFILGTNITAGTGYPLTASGGFTKTGAGASYLFSDLITSNAAVTIAGPVQIGNFNTTSTTSEIKSNGGNINLSGALSPYTGNGREYMALLYANLYDADGGSVSGSTTDIYLRFNAGAHSFIGLPGMSSTIVMQYLVAGGGGGGGSSSSGNYSGGGAGGGGVADGSYTFNGTPISIVVGAGGGLNTNGSDSYFATIKCGGGGGGGNHQSSGGLAGNGGVGAGYTAGGGGGGAGSNWGSGAAGGTGSLRNGGSGSGWGALLNYGGSGGGAVGNGSGWNAGGAGLSSSITGTAVTYGAGAHPNTTAVAKTGGGGGAIHYGTFQGANGVVIFRFALPNAATLNNLTSVSAFHLNAAAGGIILGSTVSNLSLSLTSDGTTSIAGLITGSASLTKAGSATLTLSGNHTYTGGTIVNAGILNLNDVTGNGQSVIKGELTINQNGTVQLSGSIGSLGWHASQRVTKININGGMLEAISGQQHIWNLDGGLNFNGGGTLRSNGGTTNAAATSYIEWGVGNVTVTNPTAPAIIAGRINLRSDITALNGVASGGVISMVVNDGSEANDLLISAAITQTGAATITKTGAGKMTFTGSNSHTGTMTISAGVFQVGNEGTTGSISAGAIVNNASIVFHRSNDYTISNVISGTGTIEKLGAGALTLSGANTYSGVSTVSQGVLKLGSTTALGAIAGITSITSGAALDLNGINYSTLEPLTLNGTGLSSGGAMTNSSAIAGTFAGPITLASAALIKCSTGAITLSGTINGAFALNVESTTAAYTQSGIVGATTAPNSYTINTGSGATIISANTTVAGPLTIDAGQISMNSTITSSLNNAGLTFRSQKFINHTGSTGLTLTTQGGPILMSANADDATDNDLTVNGYILFTNGLTINSNGGNITLGGGDALATGYALGTSAYPFEGLRVDGTLNISSGAGNIVMRGKSYGVSTTSGAWGLGFWNLTNTTGNGTITSGTGTIYLDGFSQSTGGTYSAALFSNGPLTITSANTTADAIKLIGKGTGTSSDAWGLECESALNVYATAEGGGITISTSQQVADNYDAVFRGETNILAKSGPIQLLAKQSGGVANGRFFNSGNFYLGSRAGSPVTTSSSNITLQYDKFDFGSTLRFVATTGTVAIQPASTSFGAEFLSSWFNWNQNSQTMSGLTLGKIGNTAILTHQTNAITAAGPVTFYGGDIAINQNLTSTLLNADVLINATGNITTTASNTIQTNKGDVIFWSDFDNSGAGSISVGNTAVINTANGSISSNLTGGGHIVMAGGLDNGANFGIASDGIPDGFAISTTMPGLSLGTTTSGNTQLYSGGGNIVLNGRSTSASAVVEAIGIYNQGILTANAGNGAILINGQSAGFYGVNLTNPSSNITGGSKQLVLLSNKASGDAIRITGTSTASYGVVFNYNNPKEVVATGGGDITVTGIAGSLYGIFVSNTDILASAGNTTLDGGAFGVRFLTDGCTLGALTGSSVTSSAANIKLIGNVVTFDIATAAATTGTMTIEPSGTSFTSALTYPIANMTVGSGVSGLTLGKLNNAANITMSSSQSVAGNVTLYGGTITLSGNLTTTNNGNVSLYSNNAIGGLTTQRNVTAAGTFTYAPQGTSFGSAVTFPINNLNLSCTGLTIGKLNNLSGITIGAATAINGPVTLYGGALTLSAALSSINTSTGDISLNGSTLSGGSLSVPEGRTLTLNLSSSTTYAGAISGTNNNFNLVKSGAGDLTLSHAAALFLQNATISAGSLIMPAGKQLTLSGTLTNNGIFTLKDGATFVPGTNGTSVTGSGAYNVEKQLTGNATTWDSPNNVGRFWYMGVPMNSVARSSFGTQGATTNRVWSYSEVTKQYTEISSSLAPLTGGTGYVHRRNDNNPFTFSATGTDGLRGTDFTLSGLTRTSGSSVGFNLVANPYMAYLDWDAITKTNVEETYYIRSHNSNSNDISALITFNGSSNFLTNNSSLTLSAAQMNYIAPLQAVWVRVGPNTGTGSLTMTRSMLSHQTGNPGLKTSTVFPTLARVNLLDGARFDQMLVYLNQDMSNAVDQYDSEKMFVSGAPQLYTMASGKKLVMNGLNSNKKKISVPLYLELPTSKVYELQLSEYLLEDGLILLEDKQEGTIQDFTINDIYAFYANSGVLSNRFVLHFYMPDAGVSAQGPSNSWVEEETSYTEGSNVQISADAKGKVQISLDQPETDKVEGTVQATDANGKVVYAGKLEGALTSFELNVPTGIYYLTVQTANQVEMKKVFIQE